MGPVCFNLLLSPCEAFISVIILFIYTLPICFYFYHLVDILYLDMVSFSSLERILIS